MVNEHHTKHIQLHKHTHALRLLSCICATWVFNLLAYINKCACILKDTADSGFVSQTLCGLFTENHFTSTDCF